MSISFFEYLEGPYLVYPYLTGFALASYNGQFTQQITADVDVRSQIEHRIVTDEPVNSQFDRRIDSGLKLVLSQFDQSITDSHTVNAQHEQITSGDSEVLSQFDQRIDSGSKVIRGQFDQRLTAEYDVRGEFERRIVSNPAIYSQFDRRIDSGSKLTRAEFGRGPVSHEICGGYLVDAYLSMPYLAAEICAHIRSEFHRITARLINTQILHAIYNTKLLRILCEFPSRGTSGTNWSVISGGTAVGDFSVNNVNSDIVEQVYRSTAKVVTIQCDTQIPQGVFNDTLAILGHNFTTSASVVMQGSNDITFGSVGISETFDVEKNNIYWISEFLPLNSYRYWRFIINDVTNPSNLQIGTIVFGASIIFNGECFIDDVVRRKTHFADRVRTEGFTSVSNDRALKRAVSLSFKRLDYNRDNYENLVDVIDTARTSLKCLWIPTPEFPSRFAVFGKLSEMPVENHKVIGENADYIDIDVTVDEAL